MSASNPTLREKVQSIIDNENYNFQPFCADELLFHADLHDKGHKEYTYMVVERGARAGTYFGTLYPDRAHTHEAIAEAITDPECMWWPVYVYDMRESYPWREHIIVDIKASWCGHDL